ncbi:hypothetical protein NYR54_19025 [Chelativorans sp. SCAU2101]|uniref:Uncharacterized protein n=1 Tax=Chelativorans petroleitrophicus TaxID=2975484 RepID=A0A9X3BAP1_9HYPH|nr:hypothetical protein [Chelativorans petroleitrophicus]MCT8992331.1 hypothetical protein [Chelativorans petroleitrophicus]
MFALLTGAMMAQTQKHMMEQTTLAMAQAEQQHQQQMLNMAREHHRALANNAQKQAMAQQEDGQKLMAEATSTLGRAAAA